MSIGRICRHVVVTAAPGESVAAVARRMKEHDVGAVVVVDGTRPVAMITDRDVALRCVGGGMDAEHTPVSSVMTRPIHTVDESTPIEEALRTMARVEHRRLVVTGPGATLVGIVSVDDVIQLIAEEAVYISDLLRKEGAPARAPGVRSGPVV